MPEYIHDGGERDKQEKSDSGNSAAVGGTVVYANEGWNKLRAKTVYDRQKGCGSVSPISVKRITGQGVVKGKKISVKKFHETLDKKHRSSTEF